MGPRTQRLKRAAYVGRVARRGGLLRVLRELGVWGNRPATREGAQEFREALEEGFYEPFSIGTSTKLPHSVQEPS
jgi:hypothetical protein